MKLSILFVTLMLSACGSQNHSTPSNILSSPDVKAEAFANTKWTNTLKPFDGSEIVSTIELTRTGGTVTQVQFEKGVQTKKTEYKVSQFDLADDGMLKALKKRFPEIYVEEKQADGSVKRETVQYTQALKIVADVDGKQQNLVFVITPSGKLYAPATNGLFEKK